MIIFLFLVIIAILLFGSSAVIGAIGAILGFIFAVLAVFFGAHLAATAFGIDTADMILYACLAILPIVIFTGLRGQGEKFPSGNSSTYLSNVPAYAPDPAPRPMPAPSNEAERIWRKFEADLHGKLTFSDRGQIDEMILRNEAKQLDWFCRKLVRRRYPEMADEVLSRCDAR